MSPLFTSPSRTMPAWRVLTSPRRPPTVGGTRRPASRRGRSLQLTGFSHASGQDGQESGDFYGVTRTREATRLIVGDVRGKGTAAGRTASALRAAFHEAALTAQTIEDLAAALEPVVEQDARLTGDFELFATAVLIELPHQERVVRILNRGHLPVLALKDASRVLAAPSGLPLGLGWTNPQAADRAVTNWLRTDELIAVCTDGVTDARNSEGDFYPLAERLDQTLARNPQLLANPGDLTAFVENDLLAWESGPHDDATLVVLEHPALSAARRKLPTRQRAADHGRPVIPSCRPSSC